MKYKHPKMVHDRFFAVKPIHRNDTQPHISTNVKATHHKLRTRFRSKFSVPDNILPLFAVLFDVLIGGIMHFGLIVLIRI